MYRDEAVKIMTDKINDMNRNRAYDMMIPSEQVEQSIAQATPELMRVNEMLYDLLVEYEVIR